MQLTPLIAVHMTAAIGAIVLGPFALWARMGSMQRPWLHRAAGYNPNPRAGTPLGNAIEAFQSAEAASA